MTLDTAKLRDYRERFIFQGGSQYAIAMADELDRLHADLRALKDFADLWYFVMDEAPLEFAKIVNEWSPQRWLDEATKLRWMKRSLG